MFPLLTLNLYDNKYKRETLINEELLEGAECSQFYL